MRWLLAGVLGLVAAGWLGGETWLARRIAQAAEADPRLTLAAAPLREPARIGVALSGIDAETPRGRVTADAATAWVAPWRLTEARLALPQAVTLTPPGGAAKVEVGITSGTAQARVAPMKGMSLVDLSAAASGATLGGAEVVGPVAVTATLATLGADAPKAARAGYDVTLDAQGIDLARLSGGTVPGVAAVAGPLRLWLTDAPLRVGASTPPQPLGVRLDGVRVTLDELAAVLRGRVVADAEGRAEGEVWIDTADARGFLQRAADLGAIPAPAVPLAQAALAAIATTATGEPAPAPGEMRLVVTMAEGLMRLGPVPLGDAPRLR